jgi:thiol-disulfide isomerase/thioredoxin
MSTAAVSPAPLPTTVGRQSQGLLIFLLVASLATVFWPKAGAARAPGGFLFDGGGRPVPMGERLAPVTLVHFWATWCPPCMTEIPSLGRLSEHMAEYRGDFTILMIAVADDQDRVGQFVGNRIGAVLFDPGWDVAHRYGTRKLPETHLVVNGEVVKSYIGAQNWDDPEIRKMVLDAVLQARPAA